MEPTNHGFRKENDLPNLHDYVYHVILQGCNPCKRYQQLFGKAAEKLSSWSRKKVVCSNATAREASASVSALRSTRVEAGSPGRFTWKKTLPDVPDVCWRLVQEIYILIFRFRMVDALQNGR